MNRVIRHPKNLTIVHEANYTKIMRVFPYLRNLELEAQLTADTQSHNVEVKILEVTRYTSSFSFAINYKSRRLWLPQLHMAVRCYYDARVAEIVNFQHHKHFHSRYAYPNPNMYQRNEKQQINRFLGEWLDYCLKTNCKFDLKINHVDA